MKVLPAVTDNGQIRTVAIPVLIPTHHNKGCYHGEVKATVAIVEDKVHVHLTVCGEDFKIVDEHHNIFDVNDLHVTASRRESHDS